MTARAPGTLAAMIPATITSTPPGTTTPSAVSYASAPGGAPAHTVRTVGDRAFVWRDGVWIDTTYDPDKMTPKEVIFLSDEYFALLEQDERVAEFYALGDHVIFVLEGHAYEVVPG
jgi:hypothetical protein